MIGKREEWEYAGVSQFSRDDALEVAHFFIN
jgi:hypothetical protein